jgi:acyl-CoA synthetase (AMP-forming)/AMP-acid ligase II
MLADLALRGAAAAGALITPGGPVSWAELRRMAGEAEGRFAGSAGRRVLVRCGVAAEAVAALVALDRAGAEAVLAGDDVRDDDLAHSDGTPGRERGVVVLTSGTAGRPREARHTWDALAAQTRPRVTELMPRWASGYPLRLLGSLQVLLQAWVSRGTFVCGAPREPEEIARYWADARVGYASATPSFWRRLAVGVDRALLRRIPLRQVTLAGEPADQALLDQLRLLVPRARITHIYATTELGRCLSISDGRAGFPASFLSAPQVGGRELRLDQGELLVRPMGSRDGWLRTGDLIRIEGDRALFAGRRAAGRFPSHAA